MATYQIIRRSSSHGRSYCVLLCPCGARVTAFLWSWAGHGFRKCPTCQRYLMYETNEALTKEEKDALRAGVKS